MRSILMVAAQELVVNMRRPGYIIMTLLIPIIGAVALLAGSLFGGQVGSLLESTFMPAQKLTGYVDQSGLMNASLAGYDKVLVAYPDEEAARAALVAKQINSYFVVPPDYLQTGTVYVYGMGGGFSALMATDNTVISRFLVDSLLAGRVDLAIQARATAPLNAQAVTLNEKGEVDTKGAFSWLGDFVVPYVFAMLFIITIFTTSGFLLQGVSTEKDGRIIEILLSSISPTQLLTGKILGLGALGLIQVLIWVGSGVVLIAATMAVFSAVGAVTLNAATVLLAIVYFMLGYLLFATLMAVAGSMGTSMRESQQIAGIFSFAAAIPFIALNVLFANPNSPLVVVLSYIPLTSPVMMLLRLGFSHVTPAQVLISLVLLVAGLAFSLWAGAKVFRVGLLMYGKRPGMKEMATAFRQA